jgi:hypothetical protein
MSWLNDIFSGQKESTRQYSTLSAAQRPVETAIGKQVQAGLSSGATPYTGQLVADMPSMFGEAFKQLSSTTNNYNNIVRDALIGQASGAPAWSFDQSGVTKRWNENYAMPIMQTWRETVLPLVQEGYNAIPGMAYSAARGKGIENAANQFYSENVAPTLFAAQENEANRQFQSVEAAAGRQLSGATALANLPYSQFANAAGAAQTYQAAQQQGLTAQYNEFLRTASENNPWLNAGMQFLGLNNTSTIYRPETTGLGQQMLGGAIKGAISGGLTGLLGL